jgi:hypothetical protein
MKGPNVSNLHPVFAGILAAHGLPQDEPPVPVKRSDYVSALIRMGWTIDSVDGYLASAAGQAELARLRKMRRENMARSTAELQARGIPFTSHNNGVHLVVAGAWDFWPSTGPWISRQVGPSGKKREGRGVLKLIARIRP